MRTIAPEIFADEFFGTLELVERVLWMGLLLVCADDQGRLLDNSAMLRNLVFPYDDNKDVSRERVDAGLAKFEHQCKIIRYVAGTNGTGKKLIQISNWWRYQKSASWMAASKFPAPDGWIDRCRYHTGGNQIVEINWKLPGGFLPTPLPSILPTPLPSREDEVKDEDDNEVKVKKIDESSSSEKPSENNPAAAPAELSVITEIFKASGAKVKQIQYLKTTPGIKPEDCWAMLAWAFSQDKFRKPGVIMAENILMGERASAEWYTPTRWDVIPQEIRQSGGLVIQSQKEDLKILPLVAIRNSVIDKPDEEKTPETLLLLKALEQLGISRINFLGFLYDATASIGPDKEFIIHLDNEHNMDMAEERISSSLPRMLSGIINRPIEVKFILEPHT